MLVGNILSLLDSSLQQKPVDTSGPRGYIIVDIVVPNVSYAGSRRATFLQRQFKDDWVGLGGTCFLGRYQKAEV